MTQLNIRISDALKKRLKVGAVNNDLSLEQHVSNLLEKVAWLNVIAAKQKLNGQRIILQATNQPTQTEPLTPVQNKEVLRVNQEQRFQSSS